MSASTKIVFMRYKQLTEEMKANGDMVCAKIARSIADSAAMSAPYEWGVLSASIEAVKVGAGMYRVNVGADYGIYQEYGTDRMNAQPYLLPSSAYWYSPFMDAMKAVFV